MSTQYITELQCDKLITNRILVLSWGQIENKNKSNKHHFSSCHFTICTVTSAAAPPPKKENKFTQHS